MRAPIVAEAASLTARRAGPGAGRVVFDGAPRMAGPDMTALSFVHGLSRETLYPLLRGDLAEAARTTGGAAKAGPPPLVEYDGELRQDGALPAGEAPETPIGLESLLNALGYADARTRAAGARSKARQALAKARARGAEALPWGDPRYPPLLACIFDPPLVLWVRGSIDCLSATCVAVVGSRGASPYGEEAATRLASDLAARGLVVVSGLARGIDAAAHRGALKGGGRTVAVLGCGVDVVYPPEHFELAEQVSRNGAIVSEIEPGGAPLKMNFPRRNRIISGLSRGVVVVEARQRSGALITADCALDQGRDVMAVPGNALSERHRGSHTLLKAGAALVEAAADVLETLNIPAGTAGTRVAGGAEDRLVSRMDVGEAYSLDQLASLSGDGAATLLATLLALELQGLVRRLPGGRFGRVAGNVLT